MALIHRLTAAVLALGVLAAPPAHAAEPTPCPDGLPAGVTCWTGQDKNGAHWWVARPEAWSGVLVVHAHGGPRLGSVSRDTSVEDLKRFPEFLVEGHAWAGSSYRSGGFGARAAAEDTEEARKAAIAILGEPRVTLLHGQSWGGSVAARTIELTRAAPGARKPYDGALLTSGVLAGASRGYDFRVDLRAVWQAVCGNHPSPSEPQYHLGIGLPDGVAPMKREELRARFDACTGMNLPVAQRSKAQLEAVRTLSAVTRIEPSALYGHLSWATFVFRDIADRLTGGRPGFGNEGVLYSGSADDARLNREVPRLRADPDAVAILKDDSDPTGAIDIPVLTFHMTQDPTAFVEHQAAYRATLEKAGTAHLLVQTYAVERQHSKAQPPHYPALTEALLAWIATGVPADPKAIAARCPVFAERHKGECRFDPSFVPAAYETRVRPRGGV